MLALDDGALARICIDASRVPHGRRWRCLRQLAEHIVPPPRRVAIIRARKVRQRRQPSRPGSPIISLMPTIRVSAAGAPRWTTLGGGSRASSLTHGYEPTREAAMAAFAKS
jgi:hypothetical protein